MRHDLEPGSIHLRDSAHEVHLLRPFLTGEVCRVCRAWSTFHADLVPKGGVQLKGLEHGTCFTSLQTRHRRWPWSVCSDVRRDADYRVENLKEKLNAVRVHIATVSGPPDPETRGLVRSAAEQSATVREFCGTTGRTGAAKTLRRLDQDGVRSLPRCVLPPS
ncbi:hypothetical protein [Streptomyces sp. NBC_00299]|uniref:hypothetical protein n=1 Tax=Streptomyces sp. NBC_00299 TaxID=2975705 RepID=UPI002E27FEBD|nr:hypothetical protein [Streptomyces sp. NBC_00299]